MPSQFFNNSKSKDRFDRGVIQHVQTHESDKNVLMRADRRPHTFNLTEPITSETRGHVN